MSKYRNLAVTTALVASFAVPVFAEGGLGLGRPATDAEIVAWDLDVLPDGTGLPQGTGDVFSGDELFQDHCAACHGAFAEGVDNWPELAGGEGSLADKDPLKTVGSYWPHLSTVYDYVRRSMPFGNAQSLTDDEVYAIVAYILYSNDIVDDEFELSQRNLLEVDLPNVDGFVVDDRAETEYPIWRAEPCMKNCKEDAEITMRAAVLDVTPETGPVDTEAADEGAVEAGAGAAPPTTETPAATDPELVAAGEKAFRKCSSCHQVGDGAKNKSGPHLNGVIGRAAGSIDGFRYSKSMTEAGTGGLVWSDETMAEFLAKPKSYIKRTKMSFAGFRKDEDIEAVIAYLKAVGG